MKMAQNNLTTVNRMIDEAFGELRKNKVDFQLITNVLYLLARELHILNRNFYVPDFEWSSNIPQHKIGITEVKILANIPENVKPSNRHEITDIRKGDQKPKIIKKSSSLTSRSALAEGAKLTNKSSIDKDTVRREKLLLLKTKSTPNFPSDGDSDEISTKSLATKQQFDHLMKTVTSLCKEYGVAMPNISSTSKKEDGPQFYKAASFSDPMIALQLATRLDFLEISANEILQLLLKIKKDKSKTEQDVGKHKGRRESETGPETLADSTDAKKQADKKLVQKDMPVDKIPIEQKKDTETNKTKDLAKKKVDIHVDVINTEPRQDSTHNIHAYVEIRSPYITQAELKKAVDKFSSDINRILVVTANQANVYVHKASKYAEKIDDDLKNNMKNEEESILIAIVTELEKSVSACANYLHLKECEWRKMTDHYEELLFKIVGETCALEDFIEEHTQNSSNDSIIEEFDILYSIFKHFESQLSYSYSEQNDFNNVENCLKQNIEESEKNIAQIDRNKLDREETEQKLECKAGINVLNHLLQKAYFLCSKGDIEKSLRTAYENFGNQEFKWQKVIDECYKDLKNASDKHILDMLSIDIDLQVKKMSNIMDFMSTIVGDSEIREKRKFLTNADPCLSCGEDIKKQILPSANSDQVTMDTKPKRVSRKQIKSTSPSVPSHQICYPGFHILHPISKSCHVGVKSDSESESNLLTTIITHKILLHPKPEIKESDVVVRPCLPCNKEDDSKIQMQRKPCNRRPHEGTRRDSVMSRDKKSPSIVIINIEPPILDLP